MPHITEVADRFATEGFVALAPDLYGGKKTTEPDEAGKEMMALKIPKATRDMSGAVDELLRRSSGDRVGVVGFCMGGGLALVVASARPDAVAACVPFYGLIPWPDAAPTSRRCLRQSSVTTPVTTSTSPPKRPALEGQLKDLGKDVTIYVYDGADHAFFNDTRPEVYNDAEAQTAWTRTVAFLHDHLRENLRENLGESGDS